MTNLINRCMSILHTLLISFLTSSIACSQVIPEELYGEWIFRGRDGDSEMVDCADVLEFDRNMKYIIYNDCEMHADNRSGIIEEGEWGFDDQRTIVTLNHRTFVNKSFSDYVFQNSNDTLTIFVKQIQDQEIHLCFDDRYGCMTERYERLVRQDTVGEYE